MPRSRLAALAVGLALLSGSLAGCSGLRFDEPPPAIPSPDAAEVARASEVAAALDLAALADAVADEPDEASAVVVGQIATGSRLQAEALGGTWTPPPRPDDPTTTPTPATPTAGSAQLLAALTEAATQARANSASSGGELGRLLASIAVWRGLAAHALFAATPVADDAESPAPQLPDGGIDLAVLRLSSVGESADLIRALDGTAFSYESLAARTDNDDQRQAWLARAAQLREASETIAVASGVAQTTADPREGIYDVAPLLELEPSAAVATMEAALAPLWLNAEVPDGARPATVDAALQCYLLALGSGAQLGALDSPAVVLPGLVLESS